jgi:hypothetical protein
VKRCCFILVSYYTMRQEHPVFAEHVDPSASVWRYFDFPKFVSLLEKQALYFSQASLLGDPLEGSFTKAYEVQRQQLIDNPPNERTREYQQTIFQHNATVFRQFPEWVHVNCWHMGDHESMAMWQGYGGGPYGLAVRSTFKVLDTVLPESFLLNGRAEPIYLGLVRYLDYSSETEQIPHLGNVFGALLCKSVAYKHENEIRAMFAEFGNTGIAANRGHFVPMDLRSLVQQVTISPLAPEWFRDVVQGVCKQFGFEFPITESVVAAKPVF